MIWSLYVMLGYNMWWTEDLELRFEEEAWEKIIETAEKNGFNNIVLDLGEGIHYGSHPELAKPGAWSRERVREEVKRLREKGIELIPKLNFSATHHLWLGDYRRMLGLPKYYEVCRDLINEVYYLFDKPRYIHLGMDEEGDELFFDKIDLVAYRRGELLWHDLQFLCDCVRDNGAKPWIWGDLCLQYPEEFRKRMKPGSVILSPWNYRGLKEEHYTPIVSDQKYIDKYSKEPYKSMNMTYVEEDPFCVRFMNESVPAARDGYEIIPCASICFGCEYNPGDMVEYFMQNTPTDKMAGFMVAPWRRTTVENIPEIIKNMELLKKARDMFC